MKRIRVGTTGAAVLVCLVIVLALGVIRGNIGRELDRTAYQGTVLETSVIHSEKRYYSTGRGSAPRTYHHLTAQVAYDGGTVEVYAESRNRGSLPVKGGVCRFVRERNGQYRDINCCTMMGYMSGLGYVQILILFLLGFGLAVKKTKKRENDMRKIPSEWPDIEHPEIGEDEAPAFRIRVPEEDGGEPAFRIPEENGEESAFRVLT